MHHLRPTSALHSPAPSLIPIGKDHTLEVHLMPGNSWGTLMWAGKSLYLQGEVGSLRGSWPPLH